ncbi:MAG TPA: DUF6691 family protein [Solirubrobacteraceae bacterium]|nr:DUF6691 family protein [Solirubrobacteraceae bacterium]
MRSRLTGLGIGVLFGVVLAWSGMSSPVIIRQALLFQRAYLFLFFASAVLVAMIGLRLLRRRGVRARFVNAPVGWVSEAPAKRHIVGSVIFGIGWGISDACPGPIATQIGQGIGWAAFTLVGVVTGVHVFLARHRTETEPATELGTDPARLPAGASAAVR